MPGTWESGPAAKGKTAVKKFGLKLFLNHSTSPARAAKSHSLTQHFRVFTFVSESWEGKPSIKRAVHFLLSFSVCTTQASLEAPGTGGTARLYVYPNRLWQPLAHRLFPTPHLNLRRSSNPKHCRASLDSKVVWNGFLIRHSSSGRVQSSPSFVSDKNIKHKIEGGKLNSG